MSVIRIDVNGVWAGSGKLVDGRIEDCAAIFCNDEKETAKIYEIIEKAIQEGEFAVSVQVAGFINLNIDWYIEDDISDNLRSEIAEAVEASGVCCPEQVVDACIAVAANGGCWQVELASAIANDAAERKALGID